MPFTDEMLKEIKNGMSTLRMTMDVTEYSMSAEWLDALLARLEDSEERLSAASGVINLIYARYKNDLRQSERVALETMISAIKAWRKSAGREGR